MSWEPAPDSLRQLATCLKDSLSGFDKNLQKQAELVRPDGLVLTPLVPANDC
jgi:hypothetical protein